MKKDGALSKDALIMVSFGSSHTAARERALAPLEAALEEAFPGLEPARAYTSRGVIQKIMARDGAAVENPRQAIERLRRSGCREVLVQPLLVIAGTEYEQLLADLESLRPGFDRLAVGAPLLSAPADFTATVEALRPYCPDGGREDAVVLMGHGSRHAANAVYACLQHALRESGLANVHVATLEGSPALEDILPRLKADGVRKVTLLPFMLVAGEHAHHDMAGKDGDSWRSRLLREGFTVDARLVGLGEMAGIGDIFVRHARAAWEGGMR